MRCLPLCVKLVPAVGWGASVLCMASHPPVAEPSPLNGSLGVLEVVGMETALDLALKTSLLTTVFTIRPSRVRGPPHLAEDDGSSTWRRSVDRKGDQPP